MEDVREVRVLCELAQSPRGLRAQVSLGPVRVGVSGLRARPGARTRTPRLSRALLTGPARRPAPLLSSGHHKLLHLLNADALHKERF